MDAAVAAAPSPFLQSACLPDPAARLPHKAELDPPLEVLVPRSVERPAIDFQPSLAAHADAARSLLVQNRIAEPTYRQPEQQIRDRFRFPQWKRAARDDALWTFTKNDVARTFNALLSSESLPPVGVAQALLVHASVPSLDALWCHFNDPKLEKRMNSRFRRSSSSLMPGIPWLDLVTGQDNFDYVCLMCQAGVDQEALDRAFAIALARCSMDVMKTLLAFGAIASACQDMIRERFQLHDVALVRLLLSSPPGAMSTEAWRHCVYPLVTDDAEGPYSVLRLCLAHRPSITCGPLLLQALTSQNLRATAAILTYANQESNLNDVHQLASGLVSNIEDAGRRHDFFTLLADSGLVVDCVVLRKELMTDVQARHLQLVRLLAQAGVAPDVDPYHTIAYSISKMDIEMLETLQGAVCHSTDALPLDLAPDSTPEPQFLRLIQILEPRGLHGKPLDALLIRAARKAYPQLAEKLLDLGASVEHNTAGAIQAAIANTDLSMLDMLLTRPCSAAVLSTTLPTAMALQSKPCRRRAIEALIRKGVLDQDLGVSLQRLVAEPGDIDAELVNTLLNHGAPIERVGDNANNAVLQAARRCNLAVLLMLCDAGPATTTLSNAIPIAFQARETCGYDAALEVMTLLLKRGATGIPVHTTLLAAALEDHRLDMVRALLVHGGEANFNNGAAFRVALETNNPKLLELLCTECPPSQASTESVLYTGIDPRFYNLDSLELLLISTRSAGAALDASWNSDKLRENPNLNTIVPCFLRHGLNVDIQNGAVLCLALQLADMHLLRRVLSSSPSISSLTAAFQIATALGTRGVELEAMSLLLANAQSAEIGQSRGLVQQTRMAFSGDFAGLQLLLRHKASVDFDDGAAVWVAATAGDLEALNFLLAYQPAASTSHGACLAAAASTTLSAAQKHLVFDSLLDATNGELAEADKMSALLDLSVNMLPEYTQLPVLLISRGVDIQFETLQSAARISSRDLFQALADLQGTVAITQIFREVRMTTMASERKYWLYEYLLRRGVPCYESSIALCESLQDADLGNLSLPKLLLEHGADIRYNNCAAFERALRANSLKALQLLSQYLLDDDTACIAFDLARKATTLSPDARSGVYFCLLQWNIDAPAIYNALVSNLEGSHVDLTVVQLLLAKGADPNQNAGRCFLLAASADTEPVFRGLSKRANLSVVLRALLGHCQAEWEVLLWFSTCLEEQHHSATIDDHSLLYECMRKFPAGSALLRLLLSHGVPPAAPIQISLGSNFPPEQCTPLIWALFAKQTVSNDSLLALLDHGGHGAQPMYSTPHTNVTAAFGCLLDKSRIPVLETLLRLDRALTLECSTPASSFVYFGTGGKASTLDDGGNLPTELPLQSACLALGNFDAYRVLGCEETPDDGRLHTAALLALPRFVEWLLNFHNPNAKVPDEFDQMVPLAVACSPQVAPWCKIAHQEADLATRQKQCLMLLAPKTNLNWRYRGKTLLNVAMDNGSEVTRIMVQALCVRGDAQRNERYFYYDKDGIQYSPEQYVLRKMSEISIKEKEALVQILRESNLQSRYFRSVMPGNGQQPAGYHGLPSPYAKAWKAHEQAHARALAAVQPNRNPVFPVRSTTARRADAESVSSMKVEGGWSV